MFQIVIFNHIFLTPTGNAFCPVINTKPPKEEDDGWLLIDVINKNYVPVIYLNPDQFKQKENPIHFSIRTKQWGPVRYEEEPKIGMILYIYQLI